MKRSLLLTILISALTTVSCINDMLQVKDNTLTAHLEIMTPVVGYGGTLEARLTCSSDNIVFTDADCILNKNYIYLAQQYLSQHNSDMLLGAVDIIEEKNFFNIIETIEFASLQAITAYTALLNNPIMCNGANLIIRRTTYLQNIDKININIASGDDMFMLHTLKKNKAKIKRKLLLK